MSVISSYVSLGSLAVPSVGLGVFTLDNEATARVVATAIDIGYRLIDTASIYGNEAGVGEGIRRSGIDRAELVVTTKLWGDGHDEELAVEHAEQSLERLGLDYVDLYLVHWPHSQQNRYLDAWRGLEHVKAAGLSAEIGVSNFSLAQVDEISGLGGTVPVVNQIELHPFHARPAERKGLAARGIATQSWSPLARGQVLDDPTVAGIATELGVTPAQVVLRWHVQNGLTAVAKASSDERLSENLAVTGFSLDEHQVARLDALDRGQTIEPDYYVRS